MSRVLEAIAEAITTELERTTVETSEILDDAISLSEKEVEAAASHILQINTEARRHSEDLNLLADRLTVVDQAIRQQATFGHEAAVRLRSQNAAALKSLQITNQISGLAETISKISKTAEILTLNGHIESARLGSAGRPFAVIVEQLRELSDQVRRANEDISTLAKSLAEVIPSIVDCSTEVLDMTERFALEQASHILEPPKEAETWIVGAIKSSQTRAQEIVARTAAILSSLQFQDRLAQDLRNVEFAVAHTEQVFLAFTKALLEHGDDPAFDAKAALALAQEGQARQVSRLGDTMEEVTDPPPSGEVLLF